jgi:D-xylose transport system permease protein
VGEYYQAYVRRIRGGDLGALPAVAGLIVLVIVFAALRYNTFVSASNFANLLTQAASITVLAMGVGFVLLLGEIDLSAGVIGGVGASISAQLIDKQGMPWWVTVLIAVAVGLTMGVLTGFLVTVVGIPSFVVTLAFFLAWQGVLLGIASEGGSIPDRDPVIFGLTHNSLSLAWSWGVVIVAILLWAGYVVVSAARRAKHGLAQAPVTVQLLKVGGVGLVAVLATAALSKNRALIGAADRGIPWIVPIVGLLLVIWTFVQSKTQFGRFVYAVGGNKEAARRAGIRVPRIIIACFVISSGMAVFSGIIEGSRIGSVTASSGTGNQLLFAVAAAVIGGTSLFGGRGKARDAIIGGLVIALIPNGLGLITDSSVWTYIITGAVLLLAASVDAITRRRRASSGR